MMQMTPYLQHNLILTEWTYPEIFMKTRHDDILQFVTSFSYIFPYYDVIDKNADINRKKYNRVKFLL